MAERTLRVRGIEELNRALKHADRDVRLGVKKLQAGVAEPVRADAEALAVSSITRIGPVWSRMRIGVTVRSVYVAPKQRGVQSRGASLRKRPNLAPLLMNKAMQPALDRNAPLIAGAYDRMLGEVTERFGRNI